MKILFVQKMAGISGSELYFLKIMPALRDRGYTCEFLSIYNEENLQKATPFMETLRGENIVVHELSIKSEFSLPLLRKINKVIKNGQYDIVHTHLIHADFWGAMVKMLFQPKMKLVSTKHGYDEEYQAKFGFKPEHMKKDRFYWVSRFAEKFMNRSSSISAGLKNLLVETGITSDEKMDVIPYGFDFSNVRYDSSDRTYRYSPHQIVIIGRLIAVKGHHYVFEITKELASIFPDLQVVIVGTGSIEQELKDIVKQHGIEPWVRFEGFQRNIHDYLKNSDIALIPSKAEGFCAVILEAWHNETPVITFDVPAPNEIIENGKTGYLVTPFDTLELKEKIITLLEDKAKGESMGKAGKKKLKVTYSLPKMVNETIAFYRKVI